MELRQLQYFVAVAEELHFGRAAERLHIAEQPLGYQIRKLEAELGFKLLARTTRSVSLTPAGASLLEDAKKILALTDRATDSAGRIASGEAGVVRLGYESATVLSILPSFVKLFRAEYPDIDLVLTEYSQAGLKSLMEEETDACLVTRYERLPAGIEYHRVKGDIAVVALPADSPLASKEEVKLSDLGEKRFLGYRGMESGPVNQFLKQLVAASDVDISVFQEAESYIALLGLVAAGLGFTIVTSSAEQFFADDIAYRPLANPRVTVDYGLALRHNNSIAAAEPLRVVSKHLARIID